MNINELLEVLSQFTNVTTVVGCLVVGTLINNYIHEKNKHIPVIMAVTGVGISVALNGYVSFEATILAGSISGLASTGLHQVFKQYISGNKEDVEPEYFDVYKDKGGK